jgi:predicted nucleic acid-binding protein
LSERTFIDSNVLVYADDLGAGPKRATAQEVLAPLISERSAVISTQVLQEYYAIATRKLKLEPHITRAKVEAFAQLDTVIIRPEIVLSAIDLHLLRSISFWDALIVRCAAVAGCASLLSEDLNHGQMIEGVRIVNPFLSTPASPDK